MSNMKMVTCSVLLLVAMLSAGAKAQSGCTNVLISMSPCRNYITGNLSTPSRQCCSQLASVVRSSPQCLCEVLNGRGSSLGITINRTQALALPGSCNVQTPPISSCNAASPMPADAPVGSPESESIVPTEGGSKTVPSREEDGSSSNGSAATAITTTTKLSFSLLLVVAATFIR
ncbi:parafibromin-like [Hibiscus syriacus]|uniref:Parafibromin-like n=1 Tax=Hibiscus syriacus TaxID=106335 RepID=A0A6A2XIR3_HIBSY|nr:non-specific lipid transfer protein GPI-anchored 19-like [Hibiscus syriacus]KAE8658349.1 parafibromin-like [Hibiscus syriacus]